MPRSFLKRQDVQYPQQAVDKDNYGIKIIEADNLTDLQSAVNLYLFALPELGGSKWYPHLVSLEYDHYASVSGPPSINHVCVITLYISGNLITPYSG